jgi:hypothetical protein
MGFVESGDDIDAWIRCSLSAQSAPSNANGALALTQSYRRETFLKER